MLNTSTPYHEGDKTDHKNPWKSFTEALETAKNESYPIVSTVNGDELNLSGLILVGWAALKESMSTRSDR